MKVLILKCRELEIEINGIRAQTWEVSEGNEIRHILLKADGKEIYNSQQGKKQ